MSRGRAPTIDISTTAIITADRPAALRRSLDALVRQCQTYGHRPRLLVIDGSQQPDNQRATRDAVAAAGETSGLNSEYVGAAEAIRFRDTLARRGVQAPTLAAGPIGSNRNLLLLLTAGEHLLSIDDDVVCTTLTRGETADDADGLTVAETHLPFREMSFFASRAEAVAATVATPIDLLSAHDRLLGRSLSSLLASPDLRVDLEHACEHVLAALAHGPSHVVKATFPGLAGDAGTHCPHRRLFGSRFTHAELWSGADVFRTAMTSREVVRVVTKTIATHDSLYLSFCTGLANRTMTPPFMPAGRNEDGLFGVMLAAVDPRTLFGHLPFSVIHDSHRPSTRTERPMLSASETRVGDLLIALVRQFKTSQTGRTAAARLQGLGHMLVEVGTLEVGDLVDLVTKTVRETRHAEFAAADRAAEDADCPEYWRAELATYRSVFLENAARRDFYLPIEFHGPASLDDGFRALAGFIRDFGQLTGSWPLLWETARDLNAAARAAT